MVVLGGGAVSQGQGTPVDEREHHPRSLLPSLAFNIPVACQPLSVVHQRLIGVNHPTPGGFWATRIPQCHGTIAGVATHPRFQHAASLPATLAFTLTLDGCAPPDTCGSYMCQLWVMYVSSMYTHK